MSSTTMMSSTTAKRSTSSSSTTTTPIVQMRIELIGIDPPIWRRILCPSETTLDEFHVIVQRAMGWSNCHLHRFEIRDRDIGNADYLEDERKFSLKDVAVNEHFVYEYDFGDSWEHDVHIEKEVPRDANASYPVCVAGQRKCPPEDCGGIRRYEYILGAHADGTLDADTKEWIREGTGGEPFNPEQFDLATVNEELRKPARRERRRFM